ncbi:hypothetical protein G9L14_000947 [Escherichia coli]|nr:hypothetical protein [Escherichia coli]EFA4099511.1 hypothetical protein [Escherichia coli]EFM6099645.1 hypothetical protein [Escherichia coli]
MESNIKGLVAAGHEMASELKAECGAVDMRSVAKLISDLATQLEVQLVRANALAEDHQRAIESIKQADAAVKLAHEKFSALAAENAAMHETIEAVRSVADNSSGIAGWHLNGDIATWEEILPEINDIETPATDAFLAEVLAQVVKSPSNAVQSVIAERQRHQSAEGWTPEHDDQYSKSQLLWASSCYVLNAIHPFNRIPFDWPWTPEWWKPTNPRRDLVKAGALILAEIERIDRQEAAQ